MQRRGTNEEKETTGYDSEQLETIGKATKQLDVSKKPKDKGGNGWINGGCAGLKGAKHRR